MDVGTSGGSAVREATIGGQSVLDLLEALRRFGVAPESLHAAMSVNPAALCGSTLEQNATVRVPASTVVKLFAAAERHTGDRLVGLHIGEDAEPRGPLSYLTMSSPRLSDGLRYARRFGLLVISTLRIDVVVQRDTANLVIDLGDPALEASHHLVDYLMMASLRSLRRAHGDTLDLRAVHLRHADVGGATETARAFGCPVRFGQRANRLVIGAGALRARSRLANPLIAEQIAKFAAALAARMTTAVTLRERVATLTRSLLADGLRADRGTVARRLQMSERSMQRGLATERTTFKAVRDAELWEVVDALLSNRSLKVEAVALSVGFQDVAAFSKAFRRWAGCSPTAYRARAASAPGKRRTVTALG